jgi:hypothetical protein
MNENLFLLEMHWMANNCAKLTLKSDQCNKPIKIHGIQNALGFLGDLIQISESLRLGAYVNGHIRLEVQKPNLQWLLQYYFKQGILNLVLFFRDIKISPAYKAMFVWSGATAGFIISVEHLRKNLHKYPFWGQIWPFGSRQSK